MFIRKETVQKRHSRLRRKVMGTDVRPRLAVYRSSKHISVQVINDLVGATLASASTYEKTLALKTGANVEAAKAVGELIAKRALEVGITSIVFDRGGNLYHGRIKALAESAREAGLDF